jgi:response regulator of citrate/malate metabolism
MSAKKVLLLDDDRDLCFVMKEMLLVLGAKSCFCTHSFQDLTLHLTEALDTDLALLDVNLGDELYNGIDAYEWLMKEGYQGRIVFFTGHARSHPWVKKALQIPNVQLLEKPAPIDKIENLLQ